MGYDARREDGSYMGCTFILTFSPEACVSSMARFILKKKNCEVHEQKDYSDLYKRIVNTCTNYLVVNVSEFV